MTNNNSTGYNSKGAQYADAFGGILGGLGDFLFNSGNAAADQLGQIQGTIQPFYQPYMNLGQTGINTLQGLLPQYQQMISNPSALYNSFGQNYQSSPGYKWNVDQMTNASNRAAAAGGMLGTPAQQQALSKNISGLANQDYQNYVNNVMGLYGSGLSGMGNTGQFMTSTGASATNNFASNIVQALMAKAQAEAAAQKQNSSGAGSLFGGITDLLSII